MHYFIDAIPFWVWFFPAGAIIGVALWFASPILIPFWEMLPTKVKVALAAVAVVFGAYIFGRNRGHRTAAEHQTQLNAQAETNRRVIHDQVENLDRPTVDHRLDKWMRDRE